MEEPGLLAVGAPVNVPLEVRVSFTLCHTDVVPANKKLPFQLPDGIEYEAATLVRIKREIGEA
jgi:hypothetical protein